MAGAAPLCLEGETEDGLCSETPSAPTAVESPPGLAGVPAAAQREEATEP